MTSKQNIPDGEWIPIYQEIGGDILSPQNYAGHKLIIKGSTYIVVSEKADEGIIKTNCEKLDIYGTDGVNKGRHLTAIYEITGDKLTICYDLDGNAYPRNFETAGQASFFLAVFERAS